MIGSAPTLIISDIHGYAEKLQTLVEHYGEDAHYIFNGDMVDRGPHSREVLTMIGKLSATVLLGNHEWALLAALAESDPERRTSWQNEVWAPASRAWRTESHMLESYDIKYYASTADRAKSLREAMGRLGHMSLLESGQLYYEDSQLLIVHAGLASDIPWFQQRRLLDTYDELRQAHLFTGEPAPLSSFQFAGSPAKPADLHQTLVTGHAHLRSSAGDRILFDRRHQPQRVMLASHLQGGDPLYVYNVDEERIVSFE